MILACRFGKLLVTKTTVLFLCPDNAFLGPLAEAYLNFRARGLMRAFSAGTNPAVCLNRHVNRLLSACGVDASGLAPKSVDIFLMPHAIIPDRVIYLTEMAPVTLPPLWKSTTSSHWWSIVGASAEEETFGACVESFQEIRSAIDFLIEPSNGLGKSSVWNVA